MGVDGVLGLLIGSFAILSASVSSESSPPEYSGADGAAPALVLEVERLNEEPARLIGKLKDVGVSVGAEKAEENATLEWTTGVSSENISTALPVNARAWELGGPTAFDVSQAMGVWHWIYVFLRDGRPTPDPCEEFIFNLTGSTVEGTWRWGKSGDKEEWKDDFTVDNQSPHHLTHEGWSVWTFVKTDYANWSILMGCDNNELSSCDYLLILSRERTLPPATLEMLRNVAEQRGFPKAHGALVGQTSC